jgi:hypothetical protein
LFRRGVENNIKALFFNLQRALTWCARVKFQKDQGREQQMRQNRGQNRAPAQAGPLWARPAYGAPTRSVRRAGAGQFGFGAAHGESEGVLTMKIWDSAQSRVAE